MSEADKSKREHNSKDKPLVRKWFCLKDAAMYLGVTVRALEGYVRRKQLPFYKPFGRILFDIDELNRVVAASRNGGSTCR